MKNRFSPYVGIQYVCMYVVCMYVCSPRLEQVADRSSGGGSQS
jgi:hypothetical protein